jgi:hypothetical protein
MIMVRAKVRCRSLAGNWVHFDTVYETDAQKSDENVRFTKATPGGSIQLLIDNDDARTQFELGKSYYVDFTPAAD